MKISKHKTFVRDDMSRSNIQGEHSFLKKEKWSNKKQYENERENKNIG